MRKELGKLRKNCLFVVSSRDTIRVAKRSSVSCVEKKRVRDDEMDGLIGTNLEIRPPAFGGLHHVGLGIVVCLWLRRHHRESGTGKGREQVAVGGDIRKKRDGEYNKRGLCGRREKSKARRRRPATEKTAGHSTGARFRGCQPGVCPLAHGHGS